jgi:hypothetical protein
MTLLPHGSVKDSRKFYPTLTLTHERLYFVLSISIDSGLLLE